MVVAIKLSAVRAVAFKRLFLLAILTLYTGAGYAQEYINVRKVVQIMPEQNFYLNGGMRATFSDGKSRVYYKIELPPNTIEWYYSFSSSQNQNSSSLNLASQLTKLLDPTGMTALATEALFAPTGTAAADIYLCDFNNIKLFMQKVDNDGGKFSYYVSGSRANYTQGVVPVKMNLPRTLFIGIKNPSASTGINVTLEIVAIVNTKEQVVKTDDEQKGELYGTMGWNAFQKGNYLQCIELSEKSLQYNKEMAWVKFNIALSHLILKNNECLDRYIEAITCCKKSSSSKKYLRAALQDIENTRDKIADLNTMYDIIQLLNQELRKN